MLEKFKQKIIDQNLNTYFICEADSDYNIKKEVIVPANPNCNCYSVAKAFTVFAIGLLYDQKKISMDDLLVDILKKYFYQLEDNQQLLWYPYLSQFSY